MDLKVRLKNTNPFTGTGYVHEYLLQCRGWNELPKEKKYGLVSEEKRGWSPVKVRFPHCENIEILLFGDEFAYEEPVEEDGILEF